MWLDDDWQAQVFAKTTLMVFEARLRGRDRREVRGLCNTQLPQQEGRETDSAQVSLLVQSLITDARHDTICLCSSCQ